LLQEIISYETHKKHLLCKQLSMGGYNNSSFNPLKYNPKLMGGSVIVRYF